jgi:hypothetical protein
LALRQDGQIVATFGDAYKSGKNFGPFMVNVTNGVNVDIVVNKLGNYTNQLGFVIRTYHGFIQFQRNSGSTF